MDNNGTANGTNVQQYSFNGSDAQAWKLVSLGEGYYKIEGKTSGKVLDVSGISSDNGANVHIWSWVNGDNQKWKLESVTSTSSRIAVGEPEIAQLKVFPNPSAIGYFTVVTAEKSANVELIVTDLLGNEIIRKSYRGVEAGGSLELDTSGLDNGTYMLLVNTDNKKTTKKITILN